jgi:hypothetical protein
VNTGPTRDPAYVRRAALVLHPDARRVIAKLFLPGQEHTSQGISRADAVMLRVLALTDDEVSASLADTAAQFGTRHHDLPGILARHFDLVAHRLTAATPCPGPAAS